MDLAEIQVGFLDGGPMKLNVHVSDSQNVFWPNNKVTIYGVLIKCWILRSLGYVI